MKIEENGQRVVNKTINWKRSDVPIEGKLKLFQQFTEC